MELSQQEAEDKKKTEGSGFFLDALCVTMMMMKTT